MTISVEVREILDQHLEWLKGSGEGDCANLSGLNLSKADLPKVNLSKACLVNTDLREANLSEANLSEAVLSEVVLSDSNPVVTAKNTIALAEIVLSNPNRENADLLKAVMLKNITALSFVIDANQHKTNLSGADLSGADLSEANLIGVDFTDANLTEAKLTGAKLTGANFTGADLTRVSIIVDGKPLSFAECKEYLLQEGAVTVPPSQSTPTQHHTFT